MFCGNLLIIGRLSIIPVDPSHSLLHSEFRHRIDFAGLVLNATIVIRQETDFSIECSFLF